MIEVEAPEVQIKDDSVLKFTDNQLDLISLHSTKHETQAQSSVNQSAG